jgi:Cu/Ag efflux pump CusA
MVAAIVRCSLRFRFIVLVIGVSIMYFGVGRLRELPVDVFPEFAPPRIEVQTICLGLSSAEVEAQVTVPLEDALNGVPGIDVMRSKSVGQLSSIMMILKPGADEFQARQMVSRRPACRSGPRPPS